MLRTVAQNIPNALASPNRLTNESILIPDWNFTCNGTITGFLLGADIRSSGVMLYPEVQIWRRTNPSSTSREYMKVCSEEIRLDAGSFSPSGVLKYHLTNPFNFQAGDIFGIYQPIESDSIVRIYYNDSDSTAPVAYRHVGLSNMLIYDIDGDGFTETTQQFLLVSTITCTIPRASNHF